MFSLIPRKAWLYGATLAALVALGAYIRWDATRDANAAQRQREAEIRAQTLEEARQRRDETEKLTDDELLDSLLGRVRPIGPQ